MTRGRFEAGFTLLEMVVVLAIIGLMLGLVLARGPVHSTRLDVETAARDLAGTLRLARGEAIAQDRPVSVAVASNGFRLVGRAEHRLPADVTLAGTAAIRFAPGGTSSGGALMLRGAAVQVAISVDWLTGRIRVQPGR